MRYLPFSGSNEATAQQYKQMSTKNENKPESTIAPISKEQMEIHQTNEATAIGCDEKKTVSGFEYLLILIRAMVREGIIDKADLPRAIQCAKGMKANNSALRQWLYERSEKADKPSAIAAKYLEM